jgi:hypothetical protein
MKTTAFLVVALAATPALAQSADRVAVSDDSCEVSMVRAPDDVRDVIDDALENEHCTTPLEVRIVHTDGGLYVFARDPHGRIRERIVPDAQAAAVLIASWASDDSIVGSTPAPWATQPAPASTPTPFAEPMHAIAPPGVTPPVDAAQETAPPPARSASHKWLALAGITGGHLVGMRAAVDLWARNGWTIGATGSVSEHQLWQYGSLLINNNYEWLGVIDTIDARALAYGEHTWGAGPWHVRASLGVGFVVTEASTTIDTNNSYTPQPVSGTGVFPVAEATFVVGRDLGDDWGLDIGLAPTLYAQTLHIMDGFVYDRNSAEWTLLGGLRHRL